MLYLWNKLKYTAMLKKRCKNHGNIWFLFSLKSLHLVSYLTKCLTSKGLFALCNIVKAYRAACIRIELPNIFQKTVTVTKWRGFAGEMEKLLWKVHRLQKVFPIAAVHTLKSNIFASAKKLYTPLKCVWILEKPFYVIIDLPQICVL